MNVRWASKHDSWQYNNRCCFKAVGGGSQMLLFSLFWEHLPLWYRYETWTLYHSWLTPRAIWICRYKWIQSEWARSRCVALFKVCLYVDVAVHFIPHFLCTVTLALMIQGCKHWLYIQVRHDILRLWKDCLSETELSFELCSPTVWVKRTGNCKPRPRQAETKTKTYCCHICTFLTQVREYHYM